ncbi:HAD family hydrolase [Sphingomonas yunnanensis]|uniref:HAD family hydrolase n=1 Tax=Sphingomonas yunnanensis TaxID=310400 RepID=UPI001CA5FA0F|nr:HAD family hydrolase [Sphingomonas yunnanensis]MBY9062332.1 HAD family hydrolase [Sphingomonas yunnanensis]
MPSSSEPRTPERVIVFDLDDTLYLERDYVISGLAAAGDWAHARLGLDRLGPLMRERFEAGARQRIFDDSLAALGYPATPALVARLLAVYRQHRPRIALAPDAARYLARRDTGTALAIVTDGFLDAQRRKLRALDLFRRGVRQAVCTDRWGREAWKPSRRAFDHLEAWFGMGGACFTYVADNPTKDFVAPRLLGWRTVRIVRPGGLHVEARAVQADDEADRVVQSLDSLD